MSLIDKVREWFIRIESDKVLSKDAVAFHKRRNKTQHNAATMAQLTPIWSMSDKLLRSIDWSKGTLRTARTDAFSNKYKEVVMISLPHQWFELIGDSRQFFFSNYYLGSDGIVYEYSRDARGWLSTEHVKNPRYLEEIRLHLLAACRQHSIPFTSEEMGAMGAHIQMLIRQHDLGIL